MNDLPDFREIYLGTKLALFGRFIEGIARAWDREMDLRQWSLAATAAGSVMGGELTTRCHIGSFSASIVPPFEEHFGIPAHLILSRAKLPCFYKPGIYNKIQIGW